MTEQRIFVSIRMAGKPGAVKAYADVKVSLPDGILEIRGFSIIDQPGKPPWVGFPSKPGTIPGKYFPVVEAEGSVRERISKAILDDYREVSR